MRKATLSEWKTLGLQLVFLISNAGIISVILMTLLFAYLGSLGDGEFVFAFGSWLRSTLALFLLLSFLLVARKIKKSGLKYRGGRFYFKEQKPGFWKRLFSTNEDHENIKTGG